MHGIFTILYRTGNRIDKNTLKSSLNFGRLFSKSNRIFLLVQRKGKMLHAQKCLVMKCIYNSVVIGKNKTVSFACSLFVQPKPAFLRPVYNIFQHSIPIEFFKMDRSGKSSVLLPRPGADQAISAGQRSQ
ncbi:hypothetical protein D3C86_1282040 [compost metagenome]